MALRLGYTLGLHTYNASLTTGPANKETLSRVWWGHYALDTMLATLTGRPSIGVNKVCSVPLPLPLSATATQCTVPIASTLEWHHHRTMLHQTRQIK
jgi:hypothetical protein